MPGYSLPQWISQPLSVVDQIFESDPGRGCDAAAGLAIGKEVEATFEKNIKSQKIGHNLVPTISGLTPDQIRTLQPNSLVRFRCMIQDEEGATYHQAFVEVRNKDTGAQRVVCAMYKTKLELQDNEQCMDLGAVRYLCDARTWTCVNIPGEVKWVRQETENPLADFSSSPSQAVTVTALFVANMGESFKLCDALEIYGILDWAGNEEERGASLLKGNFIMHVIYAERLPHCHPVMPVENDYLESVLHDVTDVRQFLLPYLRNFVCGDAVAAEYLLLHLLSSVHSRPDDMPIGSFSLNLTNVPDDQAVRFTTMLDQLVTQLIPFALTVDNLNKTALIPKTDDTSMCSRLVQGLLQVCSNTHLVLDETRMETGKLDDQGVKNYLALQTLVKDQNLLIDYTMDQLAFPANVPVLILGQSRSLIDCRYVLPIVPDPNHSEANLSEKTIEMVREYLVAAKFAKYHIPDELRQDIVNEFAENRKKDKTITGESLHSQLEMARLMSLSYGESSLTKERWDRVTELETERARRTIVSPR